MILGFDNIKIVLGCFRVFLKCDNIVIVFLRVLIFKRYILKNLEIINVCDLFHNRRGIKGCGQNEIVHELMTTEAG